MPEFANKKTFPLSLIFLAMVLAIFSVYLYFSQNYSQKYRLIPITPLAGKEIVPAKGISKGVSDEVIKSLSASLIKTKPPVSKKTLDLLASLTAQTKRTVTLKIINSLTAPKKNK